MRFLVAYGSKMGGTAGLAEMVGTELERLGHDAEVRPAAEVDTLEDFDAVIVGGALYYFFSWHKDARAFIHRHRRQLSAMPVWLFSSGPLDDSATEKKIPPIPSVRRAIRRIGARGHVTFGGRLQEATGSLPVGDWRDREHVSQWTESIVDEMASV